MKKILSFFAVAATIFAIASCNTKPSPEAVEAAAVKNADDLVSAVIANDTDNVKAALSADAAAFATLGISEEKTPDLVALYNEKYEDTLEEYGIDKDAIINFLKKRGIEIPEGPKPVVKVEGEAQGENEGEGVEEGEEAPVEAVLDSASTDLNILKEAAEEAAEKVAEKIGDYTGGEVNEAEVEEAPIPEVVPYIIVEEKPTFNGGDANQFPKWVNSQIVYPEGARERKAEGRAVANFKVGTDGQIKDVVIVRSVDPEIDAELLRVIKSSPAWTVGKQNGTPVEVSYTCPVIFKLQ